MNVQSSVSLSLQTMRCRYLVPLTPHLVHFWQWWMTELYGLLPANLKVLVENNNQHLILSAGADDFLLQHKNGDKILDIGRIPSLDEGCELTLPDDIRQTILILPRDKVLSRELTLPLATEENLREVLSFEMGRETPFTADSVYFDYRITGRQASSKTLSLHLFVTPRDLVDEKLATLAKIGLYPDVIIPHDADNTGSHRIDLMPSLKNGNRRFPPYRLNQVLAALALLLFIATTALPVLQKNLAIHALEQEINLAKTAASASNELRLEVEKLLTGSTYLTERKQTEITMIHLLNELSRVIPDDTWINRIDVNQGEFQLQGQSGSAASLIGLIEESPIFHSAQFRSPITQVARTNLERIHLSANTLRTKND